MYQIILFITLGYFLVFSTYAAEEPEKNHKRKTLFLNTRKSKKFKEAQMDYEFVLPQQKSIQSNYIQRLEQNSPIFILPPEIRVIIYKYLNNRDILKLKETSYTLYTEIKSYCPYNFRLYLNEENVQFIKKSSKESQLFPFYQALPKVPVYYEGKFLKNNLFVLFNENITTLLLEKEKLTLRDANKIALHLAQNSILKKFKLTVYETNKDSLSKIWAGIRHNASISSLSIHAVNQPLTELQTVLIPNNKITHVDLSHCYMSPLSGVTFQNILNLNCHLIHLNLSFNDLNTQGVFSLSQALPNNKILKFLNLSHNKINDLGSISIRFGLLSNLSLEILNLEGNNISNSRVLEFQNDITTKKINLKSLLI